MKKLILIILFFYSFNSYAQSFDGVAISGDLPTAISKYKAKGYTVTQNIKEGVILEGKVAGRVIELYVFVTPKTKKVCKVVCFFEKESSWAGLKSTYNTFTNILTEKYGYTENKYAKFLDPYYEGDGYELQAVGLEKVLYYSYWIRKDGMNIALEISKYKQVKIAYENVENMEIKKMEQSEIDLNSF